MIPKTPKEICDRITELSNSGRTYVEIAGIISSEFSRTISMATISRYAKVKPGGACRAYVGYKDYKTLDLTLEQFEMLKKKRSTTKNMDGIRYRITVGLNNGKDGEISSLKCRISHLESLISKAGITSS